MARSILLSVLFILLSGSLNAQTRFKWVDSEGGLRMRSGPDSGSEILLVVPDGEKVVFLKTSGSELTVQGRTGYWSNITWKNKKGWVFGGFLADCNIRAIMALKNYTFGETSEEIVSKRGKPREINIEEHDPNPADYSSRKRTYIYDDFSMILNYDENDRYLGMDGWESTQRNITFTGSIAMGMSYTDVMNELGIDDRNTDHDREIDLSANYIRIGLERNTRISIYPTNSRAGYSCVNLIFTDGILSKMVWGFYSLMAYEY